MVAPAVAGAQQPDDLLVTQIAQTDPQPGDRFGGLPKLRTKFPGSGSQTTPTPTPTPTPTATPTEEPTAEPSATPTASPKPTATPKPDGNELARTGSDAPPLLALGGMSLLGFGIALRLRLALDDARRGI
jgi:hypothetical protein